MEIIKLLESLGIRDQIELSWADNEILAKVDAYIVGVKNDIQTLTDQVSELSNKKETITQDITNLEASREGIQSQIESDKKAADEYCETMIKKGNDEYDQKIKTIEAREAVIETKEQEIASTKEKADEVLSSVQGMEEVYQKRAQEQEDQQNILNTREKNITEKETAVENREKYITSEEVRLTEKEQQLTAREQSIAIREEEYDNKLKNMWLDVNDISTRLRILKENEYKLEQDRKLFEEQTTWIEVRENAVKEKEIIVENKIANLDLQNKTIEKAKRDIDLERAVLNEDKEKFILQQKQAWVQKQKE